MHRNSPLYLPLFFRLVTWFPFALLNSSPSHTNALISGSLRSFLLLELSGIVDDGMAGFY